MFQAQHKKPRGFTKKPAQRSKRENKITLAARHEKKLEELSSQLEKTLPLREKQYKKLLKKIKKLVKKHKREGHLNSVEMDVLFNLREEKARLKEEIEALREREEEKEYHLKTACVIAEYTDQTTVPSEATLLGQMRKVSPKTNIDPSPTIQSTEPPQAAIPMAPWIKESERQQKLKLTRKRDRRQLLEAWCLATDDDFVPSKPLCYEQPNKCPDPDCGALNHIANACNGHLYCRACGTEIDVTFTPQHTSFKESKTKELVPEFPYKRANHFQEWLSQIQGKQNTEIVEKVFTGLQNEFKKHRITNYKTLTPKFVKSCLRKLGFQKYYEHAEYIIHHFNGHPPPVLTVETEEEFRQMFNEIQIPFEKCKPAKRKNFLSYSYIFYQFALLTGEDHLLSHFPLLKDRQKLKNADDIWKKMCEILKWEFIPTV